MEAVKPRLILAIITAMAVVLAGLGLLAGPIEGRRTLVSGAAAPAEVLAALQRLSGEERGVLARRERGYLARNPLDVSAIFNLAVLAELDGDLKGRDRLIAEGARRSRRDPGTQLAALQLAVAAKDFSRAADIIDGLMRSRPEMKEQVLPLAAAAAADKAGLDAAAALVARDPPWRQALLAYLVASDPSGGQAYRYLSGLAKRGVAPNDRELAALIGAMIRNKDFAKAYFIWLDMLTPAELQKAGLLFDGAFDLAPRGLYFDWTLRVSRNARVEARARDGSPGDRALVVSMLDNRQPFAGARQYLRLAPGRYELAAEALVKGARASGGLAWRVRCAEAPATLGESARFTTDQPWGAFAFVFEVPASACETQVLQLESANANAPDLVMSGQFFFDNFTISQKQ